MARKNRKNRRLDVSSFPAPFAGVVILISVFGLSYVWLVGQCDALGKELKGLEREQSALHKKYLNEEFRWMRLKSPRSMDGALARHRIAMDWPRSGQVVYLQRSDPFMGDRVAASSRNRFSTYPGAQLNE